MRALLACLLLSSCAWPGVVMKHAPETVQVTWKRVGYFELQSVCKSFHSPLSSVTGVSVGTRELRGCSVVTPDLKSCVIYTLDGTYEATIGHEVLHCFGWAHDWKD